MTVLLAGAVIAACALIAWVWPDAAVMNVIRSARRRKAQRALDGVSVPDLAKRARAGDPAAQSRLGHLHSAGGEGIPRDYAKARHWLELATEAGDPDAAYCLALQYEHGRGTPVDHGKALQLYEMAAAAGHADAQCNLGVMILGGHGARSNAVRAAAWLVCAAAQGHAVASENLRYLVRSRAVLDDGELAAIGEIEERARRGDGDALVVSGWMYASGFGRPKDTARAAELYRLAQNQGHLHAHRLLGQLPPEPGGRRRSS